MSFEVYLNITQYYSILLALHFSKWLILSKPKKKNRKQNTSGKKKEKHILGE